MPSEIHLEHLFYKRLTSTEGTLAQLFEVTREAALSALLPFEESGAFRALWRARKIAEYLIPEARALQQESVKAFLELFAREKASLAIEGYADAYYMDFFERQLEALSESRRLISMITTQKTPLANEFVEVTVSRSIGKHGGALNECDAQRALLTALLTPLRQNVGSCFATAPCIVIQAEQQENFLEDLTTLISTGKLSRVFEGKEFIAPMCCSGGVGLLKKRMPTSAIRPLLHKLGIHSGDALGEVCSYEELVPEYARSQIADLTDHALLKSWEFTIASFSDFKVEIFRWNLYASLGFDAKQDGGIAAMLHDYLTVRLDESNQELEKAQSEYEHAYMRVSMSESLLKGADTEAKARRLVAEHQANVTHYRSCKDKRDELHNLSEHYARFFNFLLEQYAKCLPEHFQELYDPQMEEEGARSYEDAPAGFRLLYKHGRADPSVWSFIYDEKDFSAALSAFFRMVEPQLIDACEWEHGKKEIGYVTTKLIYHVQSEQFITTAYERIRAFHEAHGLEKGGYKTPWSYISGGTLHHLMRCYYARPKAFSEEQKNCLSPLEQLIFYVDLFKELPPSTTRPFSTTTYKRMIALTPTHAFTLLPGFSDFARAWDARQFTYTWLRDTVMLPAREYYENRVVTRDMIHTLAQVYGFSLLHSSIPHSVALDALDEYCALPHQQLDGVLRSALPFVPSKLLDTQNRALPQEVPFSVALQFASLAQLASEGYAPPKAVVVGDTNWLFYFFAFVVNPRTRAFELWRTDMFGIRGLPMVEWAHMYEDEQKLWSVLYAPNEYSLSVRRFFDAHFKRA